MRPFLSCLIRKNLVNLSETVRHVEKNKQYKSENVLSAHHCQLPCSVTVHSSYLQRTRLRGLFFFVSLFVRTGEKE